MEDSEDKKRKKKKVLSSPVKTAFVIAIALLIIISILAERKLTNEILLAFGILLIIFFYEDIAEITVGSIFSIKREIEVVKKEQENIRNVINNIQASINSNVHIQQNVHVPVTPIEKENEKQDDISRLLNENKELKSKTDKWKSLAEQKSQNANELQTQLQVAETVIRKLLREKETAEFNYLNFFFVLHTKWLLNWIVQKGNASYQEFSSQALMFGVRPDNIQATLKVLNDFQMILYNTSDTLYYPSERAKAFLNFIDRNPVVVNNPFLTS